MYQGTLKYVHPLAQLLFLEIYSKDLIQNRIKALRYQMFMMSLFIIAKKKIRNQLHIPQYGK